MGMGTRKPAFRLEEIRVPSPTAARGVPEALQAPTQLVSLRLHGWDYGGPGGALSLLHRDLILAVTPADWPAGSRKQNRCLQSVHGDLRCDRSRSQSPRGCPQ